MSGMVNFSSNKQYVSTHYFPAEVNEGVELVLLHGWGGNALA